jgi:uncharacterized protein (TIGR02246 family)
MRNTARVIFAISIVLLGIGCKKQPQSGRAASPDRTASAPASSASDAWMGTTERWATDWNAKRLEPLVAAYAPNAVFLTATGARVSGQAQISELFKTVFGAATTDLRVHAVSSGTSGDLAYESGDYEESIVSPAGRRELKGSYVTLLQRAEDGKWRIVHHVWTEAPPAR